MAADQERFAELLGGLLDNSLSPDERRHIESVLENSPELREYYAGLLRDAAALKSLAASHEGRRRLRTERIMAAVDAAARAQGLDGNSPARDGRFMSTAPGRPSEAQKSARVRLVATVLAIAASLAAIVTVSRLWGERESRIAQVDRPPAPMVPDKNEPDAIAPQEVISPRPPAADRSAGALASQAADERSVDGSEPAADQPDEAMDVDATRPRDAMQLARNSDRTEQELQQPSADHRELTEPKNSDELGFALVVRLRAGQLSDAEQHLRTALEHLQIPFGADQSMEPGVQEALTSAGILGTPSQNGERNGGLRKTMLVEAPASKLELFLVELLSSRQANESVEFALAAAAGVGQAVDQLSDAQLRAVGERNRSTVARMLVGATAEMTFGEPAVASQMMPLNSSAVTGLADGASLGIEGPDFSAPLFIVLEGDR
jgi:hypothetical protein